MWTRCQVWVLVLLSIIANVTARSNRSAVTNCRIVQINDMKDRNVTTDERFSRHECDLVSDEGFVEGSYSINLPNELVEANIEALKQGNWFLRISDASIGTTNIDGYGRLETHIELAQTGEFTTISPNEGFAELYSQRRRHLSLTLGTRTIMILRVLTTDAQPDYNASQLAQYYFSPNDYSVYTHFGACSAWALTFESYDASNPVIDIFVNASIKGFNRVDLYLAALKAAIRTFKTHPNQLAHHVAFILPAGTKDSYWFAFGGVRDWRVVFNNTIGGIVNTVMHELGHNCGLLHTGKDGDPYGDLTSVMGYGNFRQFGPPKCFNGYNFWVLSWFADRKVEVIPTNQSQLVQLATFVDYVNTTSSQPVLLKVGNYYMVYNRAKGCNRGSGKSKDMVTVVLGNSTGPSSLVASLNDLPSSNSFLDTSFVAKRSLSIVACQVVNGGAADYVTLSISLTQAYCSTNLRAKRWH